MHSISVLIPAYNESPTLLGVIERSIAVLQAYRQEFEILVTDDGSTDETKSKAEEARARWPKIVRVLYHQKRRGLAITLEELYREAQKEIIFVLHGDGQYDPEIMREILPLIKECDIVLCVRMKKHYNPYRTLLSICYRWIPRLLFGVDLRDSGCAKCMRRSVIEEIPVCSTSVFVEAERIIRAMKSGYIVRMLPVNSSPRTHGRATGGNLFLIPRVLKDVIVLFLQLQIFRRAS